MRCGFAGGASGHERVRVWRLKVPSNGIPQGFAGWDQQGIKSMNHHASMNRIYRLIWSEVRSAWVPVAETARGRGKSGRARSKASRNLVAAAISLALAPLAHAAPPPAHAAPLCAA